MWALVNNDGEYLKQMDTADGKLEFTKKQEEAYDYSNRPGGGHWNADNELIFIKFHFEEEYGTKATTLHVVHL